MQIKKSPQVHEVVIVGSGAAGGMTAWNLTRQGINVVVLDAGVKMSRAKWWSHVKPWERRERLDRGQQPPKVLLGKDEQPYFTPESQPFDLWRVWNRGGKTNIWGRVSLRYSDLDFTGPAKDGWEIPWPIRYADVAPYYDKVEQLIGVCGGDDDQDSLPGSKFHLPAPKPRCGEVLLRNAAKTKGIDIVSVRRAVLTKNYNGKAKCHHCGACGAGCDISAFFNSTDYLLDPAEKTGRLQIIDNAVAARILVDDRGLAKGVQYFDRNTKEEHTILAKRVVVAASCIDSTRLLLNSKSEKYPNGIGNSNDIVGRYLCEQIRFHLYGMAPSLMGRPATNDDGIGGEHVYLPRFNHRNGRKNDYLRGWGSQFWMTGCHPSFGFAKNLPGFGADLKKEIKHRFPSIVAMHPYGEVLPYADNRVTVDESRRDAYGVPLPKIDYKVRDNEKKMAKDMYNTGLEIMKAAKVEMLPYEHGWLDTAGSAIHEHGTVRMGDDKKRASLNKFNQMHEVKNVFVVDGSSFSTASEKNPTLTILALAMRASDYLAGEIKRGNV
jgi:choline dehydrogenase-like flavoprotein